jgi:hypothetical protein
MALSVGPYMALSVGPYMALSVGPYMALSVGPYMALSEKETNGTLYIAPGLKRNASI